MACGYLNSLVGPTYHIKSYEPFKNPFQPIQPPEEPACCHKITPLQIFGVCLASVIVVLLIIMTAIYGEDYNAWINVVLKSGADIYDDVFRLATRNVFNFSMALVTNN